MRSQPSSALAFALLSFTGLGLAACDANMVGGFEDGAGGTGGSSTAADVGTVDVGTADASTGTAGVPIGSAAAGPSAEPGAGGAPPADCDANPVVLFEHQPVENACGNEHCCEQMTVCFHDISLCAEPDGGSLSEELPAGVALQQCMDEHCVGPDGFLVCDSGLTLDDDEPNAEVIAECLSDNCCSEFNACTSDGTAADACVDCLDSGGGPLCDAALACAASACEFSL